MFETRVNEEKGGKKSKSLNKKSALIAVIAVSPTTVRRERASDEPSDKQQAVTRYRGRSSRMITQHFSVISACEIQAVGIRLPRNFTSAKPRALARVSPRLTLIPGNFARITILLRGFVHAE